MSAEDFAPPDWYRALPAAEVLRTTVNGAGIEVLVWGQPGRPGVLLAHGARAHAGWWAGVAPLLATKFRVASVSFAGNGGSDWRERYAIEDQIDELFAAAAVAGLQEAAVRPVLVAHSYGGKPALIAAATRGAELRRTIVVDSGASPVRGGYPDSGLRGVTRYGSEAEALARFRLVPRQPAVNPWLLREVARAGLKQEDGAWSWRFDPAFFAKLDWSDSWAALAAPLCPLALVHGVHSDVATPEVVAAQRRQAPVGTPFVAIADAWHHVMLDQPIALAEALTALTIP